MPQKLLLLFLSLSVYACSAQFRALQSLPWYPTSSESEALPSSAVSVSSTSSSVLDQIVEAFNAGQYDVVALSLYPQAIREGYQRNAALYNNTRRALRQLMREDNTDDALRRMQSLYADRFRNIGSEDYDYCNSLESASWSDQQLQNERIAALAAQTDRYEDAFQAASRLVRQQKGQTDLALVLQGMFAPLNRAHAAHPEIASELTEPYQQVLRQLDESASFMEQQHRQDFLDHYPSSLLEQVRNECRRVISLNQTVAQHQAKKRRHDLSSDYAEALALYRQKNYARAYTVCNEALRKQNNSAELHILKSNILQTCGNAASSTADRVAFWCASYEAGRGYVGAATLSHLVEALRTNLFMSGVAGKLHKTSSLLIINQQVWTIDQLKEHSN